MRTGFQPVLRLFQYIAKFSGNAKKSIHDPRAIDELVDGINASRRWVVQEGDRNCIIPGADRTTLILKRVAAGSPGAVLKMMKITELHEDYLTCKEWNGAVQGETEICVAKWPKNRQSLATENIDGINIDYTWTDSNNRLADDGTYSELQVCYPRQKVGDVIFAMKADPDSGVADPDKPEQKIQYLDMSTRVWARKYTQA